MLSRSREHESSHAKKRFFVPRKRSGSWRNKRGARPALLCERMSEAVKLRLLRNGASSGGSLAVRPDAVAAPKAKAVAKLKLESVDSDAIRLFDEKEGL